MDQRTTAEAVITDPTPVVIAAAHVLHDARFAAMAALGWAIAAAEDATGAERGRIVIADLREGFPGSLAGLGKAVERARGALLAILPQHGDAHAVDAIDAGATHLLFEPFDAAALDVALRLARCHVERVGPVSGRRSTGRAVAAANKKLPEVSSDLTLHLVTIPTAFLLVGLKRFDAINAAFGRATGDALLLAVERRIAAVVRGAGQGNTVVARAEGTDFAVVPGPMAAPERLALADRIVAQLERPFMAGEHFVALGACIGMVETVPGDALPEVTKRARVALTAARDDDVAVRLLSAEDEGTALFDAGLVTDLRRALDNNEIDILFQPQVSVIDGHVVGVEALARWQHPEHGVLGAETLFSVAERSDYLTALSAHVQQRAAAKAAAWPEALSTLRLSLNVTAADIARPEFCEKFLAMIDATRFPRDRLTVEITESGLIEDLEGAATLLAALRAAGCRVAIDDFGTGYSSLAYLKALPLDYLKIDKHLAQDIGGSHRDRIVVRGVIDMARSLGLAVIAEGVETEEQLTLLAEEGCQYYQGFLCAPPLGVEALVELVRR